MSRELGLVLCLLLRGCPSYVAGLVVAVGIWKSIACMLHARAGPNVLKEPIESLIVLRVPGPFGAAFDAAPTVDVVMFVTGVCCAHIDHVPYRVFRLELHLERD